MNPLSREEALELLRSVPVAHIGVVSDGEGEAGDERPIASRTEGRQAPESTGEGEPGGLLRRCLTAASWFRCLGRWLQRPSSPSRIAVDGRFGVDGDVDALLVCNGAVWAIFRGR